jgi:hypothetical protein
LCNGRGGRSLGAPGRRRRGGARRGRCVGRGLHRGWPLRLGSFGGRWSLRGASLGRARRWLIRSRRFADPRGLGLRAPPVQGSRGGRQARLPPGLDSRSGGPRLQRRRSGGRGRGRGLGRRRLAGLYRSAHRRSVGRSRRETRSPRNRRRRQRPCWRGRRNECEEQPDGDETDCDSRSAVQHQDLGRRDPPGPTGSIAKHREHRIGARGSIGIVPAPRVRRLAPERIEDQAHGPVLGRGEERGGSVAFGVATADALVTTLACAATGMPFRRAASARAASRSV